MNKLGKIKSWYIDPDDNRLTFTQHNILFVEVVNGDPVYDGWVDFDYNENTGELSGLFEDTDINQYIDNLNDWD